MAGMNHGRMSMPGMRDSARAGGDTALGNAHAEQMMELHMRMMGDSVIRRRIMADTAMQRMAIEAINQMPAEHRAMMEMMMMSGASDMTKARPGGGARHPSTTTPSRSKRTTTPATRGHEGMNMPGMNVPGMKMPTPPKAAPAKTPPKATPPARDSMPGMDHSKMKMPPKP